MVQCHGLASFRKALSTSSIPLHDYPHNAYVPLPYPLQSVGEILSTPLYLLCHTLALARISLSGFHAIYAANAFDRYHVAAPFHPEAEESLSVINVSSTGILNTDWRAVGAGSTICGYRYPIAERPLPFSNSVFVSGRLDDGSVVLDTVLRKARLKRLEEEIKVLVAASRDPRNVSF
jgi:hypothetical protein